MHKMLRTFYENLISNSLYDVIKYLLLLFISSGTFGLIINILTSNISYLVHYSLWITILAAASVCFIFMGVYHNQFKFRPKFPYLEFQFKVLEKEYTYAYLDKNHMTFRKKLKLKALKNNIDRYHDRYSWSGCGNVDINSEFKDQIFSKTVRKDVYQEYDILFGRNLKKGEEIETSLFFELEDLNNIAVPFLCTTISEPTDYLSMKVITPKNFAIEKAIAEIFPCADSYTPLDTKIIAFNNYGEAKWEISKPRLLYVYSLRWKM